MFVNQLLQLKIDKNPHYIQRYVKFILTRKGEKVKYKTHLHHILPKSKEFFPEFKNLNEHKWNGIYLTAREHFIAHQILHHAFPGSAQTRAYYLMCNENKKITSKSYAEAKKYHSDKVREWFTDPIKVAERSKKISQKTKGVAKSEAHIAKMIGHSVTDATRTKLRNANLGKTASIDAKLKMSLSRTGKKRGAHTEKGKNNISIARKAQNRKWFNNGSISKQFSVIPDESWVRGRLPWK